VDLGVIDEYTFDPASAVTGADVVVVACTLGATPEIFAAIAPAITDTTIVTDVGSAKQRVVDAARSAFGANFPRFIPGHPIAGTERSGVEASFAGLFRDHRVILTPERDSEPAAVARIGAMWRSVGATVVELSADRHDEVLAATSHLPHMLAYALVDCLAKMDASRQIFDFAAGGFRDFSRIASSDPAMWRDIALDNRDALLTMLDRYAKTYEELRSALKDSDRETLYALFSRAKTVRDDTIAADRK
jgi:prephenate dehydrogenase